jgi:DNA polymerase III epsilon subunit-like protein
MMNRSPNVGGPYEAIGAGRRFAAIDVETANAQRASICAVGIAVVEDGEVAERHHWLVRPPDGYGDFSSFNTRIHGIRAADVVDAPAFASLIPQISDLLSGLPVVAHNASFDIGAIRLACLASEAPMPTFHFTCTMALARAMLQLPSYSLPFCAEALGIEMGQHHDPLADAEASARIALALLNREEADGLDALLDRCRLRWGLLTEIEWLRTRYASGGPSAGKGTQPANPDADPDHQLYGLHVALTGDLVVLTRQQAFEQLAELGAIGQENVTKATQLLVVGDLNPAVLRPSEAATGKMRKAFDRQAKGQQIEVMSGYDFLAMLE